MSRRTTRTVIAARADYIEPTGCDSLVAYKVIKGRHLFGEISLTDCSRKIEWYFDNDDKAIPKIDRAIAMLIEFRDQFAAARKKTRTRKTS